MQAPRTRLDLAAGAAALAVNSPPAFLGVTCVEPSRLSPGVVPALARAARAPEGRRAAGVCRTDGLASLVQQTLDLREVIQIVSGVQPHEVRDAFPSSLGVQPCMLVARGVDGPKQSERRLSQDPEERDRIGGRGVAIAERRSPGILVERLQRYVVLRQHRSDAPGAHDLGVGQVGGDLGNGPGLWCWFPGQRGGRCALHERAQAIGRFGEQDRGVPVADKPGDARNVLLGCLAQFGLPERSSNHCKLR